MILDLHRQGLTVSAIARELGVDRKTVRRCIARGLEPPVYGPRKPRKRLIDPFVCYLRERVTAYPGLTGRRGGSLASADTKAGTRPSPTCCAIFVRHPCPPLRFASRRRPAIRPRWTSPSSRSSSPTSRRKPGSSGYSPSCSATAG